MKRATAVIVLLLVGVMLTGCEREKSNFERCIEAGGSFEGTAWGDNCTMPAQGGENRG